MLNHIRWFKHGPKPLHSFPLHVDRHRSVPLGHIFSDSSNSVILWKPNVQSSFREPKCVQNEKLCSITAGRSKEWDLSVLPESHISKVCCLSLGLSQKVLYHDDSKQQNLAFLKHNYVHLYNKHLKRQQRIGLKGTTRLVWHSRSYSTRHHYHTGVQYHKRGSEAARSYSTGHHYHTGVQYHKRGSEAAKWKQGTQPGL